MATPMSSANTATTKIQRTRRTRDFLLGVIDVFQRIVEQFIELLRLFGHVVTLRWCGGCHDKARGFCSVPQGTGIRGKKEAATLRCRGLLTRHPRRVRRAALVLSATAGASSTGLFCEPAPEQPRLSRRTSA